MTDDNSTQPIIDTDIWVYLIQSGYDKRLIRHYGFLFISDIVEKEISRWNRNSGESQKIAIKLTDYKSQNKVRVIDLDSFDNFEQKVINHQLKEYGLQQVTVMEKNKGEFVSLIYALHKNLERFKTNDKNFSDELSPSIKDRIIISNWNDLLDKYSTSIKEKSEARRVTENRQKKMKQSINNIDSRWAILKTLKS